MNCDLNVNKRKINPPSQAGLLTVLPTDYTLKWNCLGNISIKIDSYPLSDGITYYSPPYTTEIKKDGIKLDIIPNIQSLGLPNSTEYYFTFSGLSYGSYEIKVVDNIGQEIYFCHEIKIENGMENPCEKAENYKILSMTDNPSNPLSQIRNTDGTPIINLLDPFKGYISFHIKRFIPISNIDPGMCFPIDYVCCKSFYIEIDPKSSIVFDPSEFTNSNLCMINNLKNGIFDPNRIFLINSKKILIQDDCLNIKDYVDSNNKGSVIRLPVKSDTTFGGNILNIEPLIDTNYFEHNIPPSLIPEDNITSPSTFNYNLTCASCTDLQNKLSTCKC